ncbi:hypothetical protein AGMMS49960_06440 [Betaproteobacteria bacterium]|nr:hypothetical protein AGMMS49543_01200 [Betaproteobacteria bacterium]GHT99881.1 hypothetical protein AGMMS49960_06440 [Betaproteobacteria bacterium]GHU13693.1 hypothetical protein AGMMS50225_24150 [Betaproteobacteria bacterium]GHU19007.1 hypothetical protein AGMMS50243_10100 [Betaproteobacteria bacterium]
MDDNTLQPTFDSIEIRRPALARAYLDLLATQPGRPLALFAPRRVGKTFFLDRDLMPAATETGVLPVYADLWLYRTDPLGAINHALEEALDAAAVPKGAAGKLAATPVKSVTLLGAGVSLGDAPRQRDLPDIPELRLDTLVVRLAAQTGRKILLLLDEVQTLADFPSDLIATLRAVLHKRKDQVSAVFTGSSQEGLARLTMTSGAPMYQFTQLITFPVLGDEYLSHLILHFASIHAGKHPDMEALRVLFARLGYKPALLRDIVKSMSAEGMTDVDLGLMNYLSDDRQTSGWNGLLSPLDHVERMVLTAIGQGLPPLGKSTIQTLSDKTRTRVTVAKVRSTIEKLRKMGILSNTGNAITIDDPLFAEFVKRGHQG